MKKVIGIPLSLVLTGVLSTQVTNANESNDLYVDNIDGKVVQTENELHEDNKVHLDGFNISNEDGAIDGDANLVINDSETEIQFNGVLLPIKGEGYYTGDVIGDIEASNGYNVLQFHLEEEDNILSLIIEDSENGDWMQFEHSVDDQKIDHIYDETNAYAEKHGMGEDETQEEVIELLNIHNKAEHGQNQKDSLEFEMSGEADTDGGFSVDEPIGTQQFEDLPVDYSELNRLLSDLSDSGSANLSDYNLPESLFRDSGWKRHQGMNSDPRFTYHAHSQEQIDMTLTQISLLTGSAGFTNLEEEVARYDFALTVGDGILVEYDHNSGDIDVVFHGAGLAYMNLELGQTVQEDTNVYRNQTLNGTNLESGSGSGAINYLVGLVPFGDNVSDIWDVVTPNTSEDLGQTEVFSGQTAEEQREFHDDRVYSAIAGDLSNWVMQNVGSNTSFQGEIHRSGGQAVNVNWSYRTDLGTNL
ncbi:hypothetical protein EPH95_11460 [Salicibibacter halophilus]|uniref:Uncharacterized protein n=1 Tax=Salicibibacter halophilus TaxID=2502791 RepID=A0A514LIP0_9BACI|nr:hypothetical protein [Salicibibacter halophilus]QDI91713.1 hypothetical protein EPH95_11460 [Salicibibacter halophilus]